MGLVAVTRKRRPSTHRDATTGILRHLRCEARRQIVAEETTEEFRHVVLAGTLHRCLPVVRAAHRFDVDHAGPDLVDQVGEVRQGE
jgi:hypothetical protein